MDESARSSPYVFLSYASADRARALRIADQLEGQGIPVWIDRHSIEGGATWSAEIVRGVKGCTALVVLCSAASMASPNVQRELNLAVEENRPILPLLLERAPLPDEVRYALAGRQWVEVLDLAEDVWWPRAARALARFGLAVGSVVSTGLDSPVVSPPGPTDRATGRLTATTAPVTPDEPAPLAAPASPTAASSPLSRLLARAPLVGREAELAYLREQYDAAAAGQGGRLVFISGEPGAGKTRLAQEIGAYARQRGGTFLQGHYLRDGTAAYGPWVEALHPGLRSASRDEIATWAGAYAADLAQTIPDLVEALGPVSAPPILAPDEQRRRLLEGIARLVVGLSQKMPLVLLLDDLQWAPGLTVLAQVTRHFVECRALIVSTYREREFKEQPVLLREWAELNRTRLATELSLHLLSEPETAELIGHYFGPAAASQLTAPVYRQTHGNAFFTEEVLRSLTESGAVRLGEAGWEVIDPGRVAVPESMRLAVEERIARLGEGARDVLVQAAVLGQEFGFEALRALTGRSEDDLLEIVERAQQARTLVDRSRGGEERYGFWDDQMQEVLYASIPTARRRRYHLRAGQALETVHADHLDGQLEELARHFGLGNLPEKGAEYAFRAGEKNERLFNWVRAGHLYGQAAEALAQLPETDETLRRRIDTILRQVALVYLSDTPDRNLDRLTTAESLLRALSRSEGLSPGYEDAPHPEDRARYARLHFWLGRLIYYSGRYPAAIAHLEQALAAARETGAADLAALSSSAVGRLLTFQGRFGQGAPLLAEAIAPLEEAQNWSEWTWNMGFHIMCLAARGHVQEAISEGQRTLARVMETRNPSALAAIECTIHLTLFLGGSYRRALEQGRVVLEAAEQSRADILTNFIYGFWGWGASRMGDHAFAAESLAHSHALRQAQFKGGQLVMMDWFAAADAEATLARGCVEVALALAEKAVVGAQAVGGIFAEGVAQRTWAQALAIIEPARWDGVQEHLAASLRCFEEGDARLEAARTRVAWGQLLRDRGDLTAARGHLERAAAQFEASGLTEELERTRAVLAELT